MRSRPELMLLGMLALFSAHAQGDCRAQSPAHTVALVELYTSEGCDSCPPADRWLSQLVLGADAAVPLALHVDYWDRLGWKDRFASAVFTARQYEEVRRQRTGFVYTPQVVVQGRDFPQWRTNGDPAATIAAINTRPARARIELAAEPQDGKVRIDVHAKVPDPRDRTHAVLAVALVQDGLVSDVRAGENAGKRLAHDHVVRQWRVAPAALDAAGTARQQLVFALPAETGPLSIVAFAEDAQTGEVLQGLSLPLCTR